MVDRGGCSKKGDRHQLVRLLPIVGVCHSMMFWLTRFVVIEKEDS